MTDIEKYRKNYIGEIQNNTEEALEHKFFSRTKLPENLNACDKVCILDWVNEPQGVVVD